MRALVRYGLNTGTRHLGKFGIFPIPVPDASVCSVQCRHEDPTLRYGRYKFDTGTRKIGKFITYSIPVPDTLVTSAQTRYQYPILCFGMIGYRYQFGTTSIPVPYKYVSSVRSPKYTPDTGIPSTTTPPGVLVFVRYRARYPTEHSGTVWFKLDTGT